MIRRLDKTILTCVLLLAGVGLVALWTEAPPTDLAGKPVSQSIFVKQSAFLAAALVLMALTALPNYQNYRRGAFVFYVACVAALGALLVVGRVTRGARGWFAVGPLNVQPAEFMKIALVLSLARALMYAKDIRTARGLLLPAALAALPAGLVLLQPDMGTAILLIPTLLAMLFAAGARKLHLAAVVLALLVAAPAGYFFGLKPYQRDRLTAFLRPQKVSPDLRYQQEMSVRACASGALMGRGLGESGMNFPFHIPDRHTDFVYSVVAEEMGFAGSAFVLLLFGVFFLRSMHIARKTREPFGKLVVTGLTTLLATQTFINLGMTIGVAPITGVTLPFISYGGSSLLTCALAAGLVLNVGMRWQPGFSSHDMAGGSVRIESFEPRVAEGFPR